MEQARRLDKWGGGELVLCEASPSVHHCERRSNGLPRAALQLNRLGLGMFAVDFAAPAQRGDGRAEPLGSGVGHFESST